MTIKLLADWPPYPINALLSLTAAEETALIADKLATATLTGGFVYQVQKPVMADDPVNQLSLPQVAQTQALVSGAGNDSEPATRPGRGYVVAADLRAANVAATFGSPVITDAERIAPDGVKLRGIRMQSTGVGTQCSVDLATRGQTFATGRLSLLLYADHTANSLDPNVSWYVGDSVGLTNFFVTNAQIMNARGWQLMSAGLTGSASNTRWIPGGPSPAWGTTSFIRNRIRLDYTTGQQPWIEAYEIAYNEDPEKSWISISIDDGYLSAYEIGAPALERYGMRGTFAVIADKIGTPGYMTWDHCRDLRDRGHEISPHGPRGGTGSLNNYAGSATRNAEVRADASYHRNEIIREVGNIRGAANVYVYPQGVDRFAVGDESIRDALITEGFVGARRASPGRQPKRNLHGNNPWIIPYMGHYWVSGGEAANIAAIAAQFDAAADQRHDGALMLHRFTTGTPTVTTEIGLADLETLLTKLADNRAAGTQEPVLLSRQVYALAGLPRPII